jgi:beta-N-acetylhexosaminidase
VLQLPEAVQQKLRQFMIGGVVLFAANLQEQTQIRQLTTLIQQSSADDLPMLVATDQEGGRVARLPEAIAPAFFALTSSNKYKLPDPS